MHHGKVTVKSQHMCEYGHQTHMFPTASADSVIPTNLLIC